MSEMRPRVLLVKPVLPYPPDQGTKVVSFDVVRGLQGTCDVTVLARLLSPEDVAAARALEPWCARVVAVPAPNRRSLAHRVAYKAAYVLRSLVSGRSLKSLYDCPGNFRRAAAALARENFDVVVIEYWHLYPLFRLFPRERVVLLTHDIDAPVNRQKALLETRLWRKITAVRRWMVERREETRAYRGVDRILALTERDAHNARVLSGGRAETAVLPFGVDPERLAPPPEARRGREVLFMGALSAAFNLDALDWFVREVVPRVWADDRGADARVTVVGGSLPGALRGFERDGRVTVVGHVGDVRPFLHRAACLVVPLRFGGGLRIRILEAMMAGLPVVCTPVAIAGMDFEPGEHFVLARDPRQLAGGVCRLLYDPAAAAAMADRARARAVARYGSAGQSARLRDLFQELAKQPIRA